MSHPRCKNMCTTQNVNFFKYKEFYANEIIKIIRISPSTDLVCKIITINTEYKSGFRRYIFMYIKCAILYVYNKVRIILYYKYIWCIHIIYMYNILYVNDIIYMFVLNNSSSCIKQFEVDLCRIQVKRNCDMS